MADIDAEAAHKAVDFLADFEKRHGAKKPDQDIPCDCLPPSCRNFIFNIGFRDGKGGHYTETGQNQKDRR